MIKEEKRLEAVNHARKYFTTAESDQMDDIQKVMALLGKHFRFLSYGGCLFLQCLYGCKYIEKMDLYFYALDNF